LIYKTLVLTGLRKGELRATSVRHVELDGKVPYLVLDAADEKAGRGAEIPLRGDLADDLGEWLADKLKAAQEAASFSPISMNVPPSSIQSANFSTVKSTSACFFSAHSQTIAIRQPSPDSVATAF